MKHKIYLIDCKKHGRPGRLNLIYSNSSQISPWKLVAALGYRYKGYVSRQNDKRTTGLKSATKQTSTSTPKSVLAPNALTHMLKHGLKRRRNGRDISRVR